MLQLYCSSWFMLITEQLANCCTILPSSLTQDMGTQQIRLLVNDPHVVDCNNTYTITVHRRQESKPLDSRSGGIGLIVGIVTGVGGSHTQPHIVIY